MKKPYTIISYCVIIAVTSILVACSGRGSEWKSLRVQATAYNSVISQTDSLPNLAAWGDILEPGMNCIAVSSDLIDMGLGYNTQVKIEGLRGIYVVKDKMNSKYSNKIDIFMGKDIDKAMEWGNKDVTIQYRVKKDVDRKSENR